MHGKWEKNWRKLKKERERGNKNKWSCVFVLWMICIDCNNALNEEHCIHMHEARNKFSFQAWRLKYGRQRKKKHEPSRNGLIRKTRFCSNMHKTMLINWTREKKTTTIIAIAKRCMSCFEQKCFILWAKWNICDVT